MLTSSLPSSGYAPEADVQYIRLLDRAHFEPLEDEEDRIHVGVFRHRNGHSLQSFFNDDGAADDFRLRREELGIRADAGGGIQQILLLNQDAGFALEDRRCL